MSAQAIALYVQQHYPHDPLSLCKSVFQGYVDDHREEIWQHTGIDDLPALMHDAWLALVNLQQPRSRPKKQELTHH